MSDEAPVNLHYGTHGHVAAKSTFPIFVFLVYRAKLFKSYP